MQISPVPPPPFWLKPLLLEIDDAVPGPNMRASAVPGREIGRAVPGGAAEDEVEKDGITSSNSDGEVVSDGEVPGEAVASQDSDSDARFEALIARAAGPWVAVASQDSDSDGFGQSAISQPANSQSASGTQPVGQQSAGKRKKRKKSPFLKADPDTWLPEMSYAESDARFEALIAKAAQKKAVENFEARWPRRLLDEGAMDTTVVDFVPGRPSHTTQVLGPGSSQDAHFDPDTLPPWLRQGDTMGVDASTCNGRGRRRGGKGGRGGPEVGEHGSERGHGSDCPPGTYQ